MTNPTAGAKPERAALSRDLADFLIELSISLHRYAMYPSDHPSLAPSAQNLATHLDHLLEDRGQLSLGVARSQLVIEGVATDSKNPVLSDLAGRLHRHHLGAITFKQGVVFEEIDEVLRLVAVEADRAGEPLGLSPTIRLAAWPHIRLYPLTYDRLELVGDDQVPTDEDATSRSARTRAAQLWVGLARAAMVGDDGAGTGDAAPATTDDAPAEPAAVAKAIDSHPRDSAYEQVIVGYMLQIADELKASGGGEAAVLKKRVSKLVSTLEPTTVRRLLEMGGDRGQRRHFLLNASQGMAVDAVLDLVRAASEQDGQTVSHSMLRMLQKLAKHAQAGDNTRRVQADSSMREQIAELVRGWSLSDPNPDGYRLALENLSVAAPVFATSDHVRYLPEPRRLLEMALEVDAMGEPVRRAVDELVQGGKLATVVQALGTATAPEVTDAVWELLGTPERLAEVLTADPVDSDLLSAFVTRMGIAAADPMLDALADAESRQKRRLLLDTIIKLGSPVAPYAAARLDDERWFVQRNMLNILTELHELPADFSAAGYMEHAEPRVRREAYRVLIRAPASRERALGRALTDDDERNVRLALTTLLDGCPPAIISLVVSRALQSTSSELKTMAVKVLGASGQPAAINALLRVVEPRKTLFGSRLPAKSPELLAALSALQRYGSDPRARAALAEAARSKDPDIARAAAGGGEG